MSIKDTQATKVLPKKAAPFREGFVQSNGGLLLVATLGLLFIHTRGSEWWRGLYDTVGPHWSIFITIFVIPNICFLTVAGSYALLDLVPRLQKWALQYKTQPNEPPPTWSEYAWCALIVLKNIVFVEIPLSYCYSEYLMRFGGPLRELPSVWTSLSVLLLSAVLVDVIFFSMHKLMHQPAFYKHFHKQHHQFTAPCALSAKYCTMTEHLLVNLLAVIASSWILRAHPLIVMLWTSIATTNATCVHSGYDISNFFPNPYSHDWHHEKWSENFGSVGFMDDICGTNESFKKMLVPADVYYRDYHPQYVAKRKGI